MCVSPNPPVLHLDEAQIGSGWKKDLTVRWERWGKTKLKKPRKVPLFLRIGTDILVTVKVNKKKKELRVPVVGRFIK